MFILRLLTGKEEGISMNDLIILWLGTLLPVMKGGITLEGNQQCTPYHHSLSPL